MLYEDLAESLSQFDKEAFLSILSRSLSDGLSPLCVASDALRPLAKEIFGRFKRNDISFHNFFL